MSPAGAGGLPHHPVTTTPDAPVTDAAKRVLERKIGCPVEDGQIAGILTKSDFVRQVLE